MTAEQLKINLREIMNNDFEIKENESYDVYIEAMLLHIGDLDPVLRDDLIYSVMAKWVYSKAFITLEKQKEVFDQLLSDDYLFYNINKIDDTSVYKRTFTLLAFSPILHRHRKEKFLSDEQMTNFRKKIFEYLNQEEDFRGFDDKNGWAHAFAHWSDLTYFLTYEVKDYKASMNTCLNAIQDKYLVINTVLSREEDERLVTNIVYEYISEGHLSIEDFTEWLSGFEKTLEIKDVMFKSTVTLNVKNFLRSLYFRLKFIKCETSYINAVENLESKFNNYLYKV